MTASGVGRFGGRAVRRAQGVIYNASTNEEGTKVSQVIKRVPFAAVAVAAICAVAACASGPPKTEAQRADDKATAERVEAALSADKVLYAKHISVHADNGVVHLSGYVWERPDLDLAVAIASTVPGVTRVVNDLELQRNGNENGPVAR